MSENLGVKPMKVVVYHGETERVDTPICRLGRENLDFGRGFYVTDIKEQAYRWAVATAKRRNGQVIINIYQLDRERILSEACCKVFKAYDLEWLEFIIGSRCGLNPAAKYDYIESGVADDRVIDTVNLYMSGLMSADMALQRLAQHQPNNQICLLNQSITDKYLTYDGTELAE